MGYGTFHQQYWIDNKLVAVGVLDILPKCITSVYFFYDPDYLHLTLGTYGSFRYICFEIVCLICYYNNNFREVAFTKSIQTIKPDIKYYYLGYYIHSCPKMRYKGKLKSSYLLCPETYQWFPLENCLMKLDINKYARLNENLDAIDSNICRQSDVENIKILIDHELRLLKDTSYSNSSDSFKIIGSLIGKNTMKNMIILCY